ncbi:MAG: T9SS type A sorting domain-containing protein [Flavobacteriaceae bacterium]|nr:T9SS type A sorting domain-containing protein [Flavobacteriaceae bacterium]
MRNFYFLLLLLTATFSFAQTPIITAIVDGDCTGGTPKFVEIYADGTVDFSLYSIENQVNANLTWGNTTNLAPLGIVTDDFVYVTSTADFTFLNTEFPSTVGAPTLTSGATNNNGDDKVRIIEDATLLTIDQFGVDGVDGTGQTWEYQDSYALRLNGTGPDAGFTEANWSFGGVAAFNNEGTCQSGTAFETLMGGIAVYSPTGGGSPNISAPSSAGGMNYFEGNFDAATAETSISVSGINLTADVVATAPANFSVSLSSGTGFGSSVNLTQSGGTLNPTTLYIRLDSGLTSGNYIGDLVLSSTGATNVTVSLSGDVNPAVPQLSVAPTFLSGFNYSSGSGPSLEGSFDVSGLFLTSNVMVTSGTGNYEVSLTSGSGFSNSVSLSPTAGTLANTTVYVRLAAGLADGNYDEVLDVTTTGATEVVNVSGAVASLTNALILTGVFDGPLTGGTPKGIEIFVAQDIADLSAFGVARAVNGGGSNSTPGFVFPAVSATAGDFIYVASEQPNFNAFFGFDPDFVSGEVNVNGDDAIELFENGIIIDTFGEPTVDGTGQPWEYLDGWAYRLDDTGPDGGFVISNWTFSGINVFDGEALNATAATPFPVGTYSQTLSVGDFTEQTFAFFPNPNRGNVLNFVLNGMATVDIVIFNTLGQIVLEKEQVESNLNISGLNAGVYFVKAMNGSFSTTKKLIIE